MEHRLVLNNRSTSDIPNSRLCGELRQQLEYFKFRRVPTKTGKGLYYLFFRKEQNTYHALRAAKSINDISLVRYCHRNIIPAPIYRSDEIVPVESEYHPVPSKRVVDAIRHSFTKYYDRFATKV